MPQPPCRTRACAFSAPRVNAPLTRARAHPRPRRLYDAQWRRALAELRDLVKADSPEVSKARLLALFACEALLARRAACQALTPAVPQTLTAWCCVYLRYVRLLRDLDDTHDQARPSHARGQQFAAHG